MTDHELLLAISDMMDTKLKSELKPIKRELQAVKDEVGSVKGELQAVKDEVQSVKDEVQSVKDEVQSVKGEVWSMKGELQSVKNEVGSVKGEVQSVKEEVHQLKLFQENIILPRLETIESCYTDTYDRYRDYADKMEAAFDDIDLLKKVVTEHSEKLQKLA